MNHNLDVNEDFSKSVDNQVKQVSDGEQVVWEKVRQGKRELAAAHEQTRVLGSPEMLKRYEAQAVPVPEITYGHRGWRATKGPVPTNTSGFYATGHRVLLLGDQVEETTVGGIIIPRKTAEAEQNMSVWATVIEIGCDAWSDKSCDFCQVGDKVLVGKYTGMFCDSPVDKKTYRFINDLDIITPLKKAE